MNARKRNIFEKNILASLISYRYVQEIKIVERELNLLKESANMERSGIKKVVNKVVGEPLRNQKEKHLVEDLKTAKENLHKHLSSLEEGVNGYLYQDEKRFREIIESFFHKDNGSAQLTMGMELALRNEGFVREQESLAVLSTFLLEDKDMMRNMRAVYIYIVEKLSINPLERVNPLAVAAPLLLISSIFPLTGLMLAGAAGGLLLGSEVRKYYMKKGYKDDESLLLFSTLVGGGNINSKLYAKKISKKLSAINAKCSEEELLYSIALGLTIYNFHFVDKRSREAKEALDCYIKMIDDLRSDAEYMAFVERINVEKNYRKITIVNKAVTLLKELTVKGIEETRQKEMEMEKNTQKMA